MKPLQCILLLQLTATLAFGQTAQQSDQPQALVKGLYQQVVARHPLGIPGGADWKVFAPYLSTELLHRIDVNIACQKDWHRQNLDPNSKPPGLEHGLFSGDDMEARPQAFEIERTQTEEDGSFRVTVRLTWASPPEKPLIWHVVALVVRENGNYVVNDVLYENDQWRNVAESRLSEYLSQGCDGPRWVGEGDKENNLKQQK